jgi:hypothetical protein
MASRLKVSRLLILVSVLSLVLVLFSFQVFADEIKIAVDPTRIAVGARALGMGKMGLSLADDCNAIFLNPAGISQLSDWQVISMTGRFINEVTYLQLGGTYATQYGNFGLGYVGASIGADFATPTFASVEGEIRIIPSSTEGSSFNYNNGVFLLGYGARMRDLADWGWSKDLSFGANLKIFTVSLTGTGLEDVGTANGYDVDLGVLYKPTSWLSAGITGQNIIPYDMGGVLLWADGIKEDIPAVLKTGASAKLVGNDGLLTYGGHELYGGIDMDYPLTGGDMPLLFRIGLEWWPIEYVALRVGVDQDYVGTGTGGLTTTNNLTAGVGLLYSGFRFDYAYHQYNNLTENDTHYFSLGYNIWKEHPAAPAMIVGDTLKISEPADKSIVYSESTAVVGQVAPEVKRVTVNDAIVPIGSGGGFSFDAPLNVGKNALVVKTFDEQGNSIKEAKVRVLRLLSFKDVPADYWAKDVVAEIATLGIVTGYPDGTFRPDGPINRAEVTTLLVRALGEKLPDVGENVFVDLPATHWAAKYIKEGSNRKYVLGYPDGTFRPANRINKAEGVVLLARFGELTPPENVLEAPYPDLPGRHWAAPLVTAAKQAGLLQYLEGRNFEPANDLTRAEAVEILSKTKFANGKIGELTNFEAGY